MVAQSQRTISFGYYPEPLTVSTAAITIEAVPNLSEIVAAFSIEAGDAIDRDWVYAPVQEVPTLGAKVGKDAYISRIFGLAKTHTLTHQASDSDDHLAFLVWTLSFFLGIRLTTTKMGFVDATPIRRGKLVDFHLGRGSLGKALEMADAFWVANRAVPKRAKWFASATHALFIGQNPILVQYESFLHLYMALDACYALASSLHGGPKRPTHAERIAWMCKQFGIETPSWVARAGGRAEVPGLRNDTLHEALFMDEPLGFAIHGAGTGHNVMLEMQALICRFLVALIGGAGAAYVMSPINTRSLHGLDFV